MQAPLFFMKQLTFFLFLLFLSQLIAADIFEISPAEYFRNMLYWGCLDISNNYADEIIQDDLTDAEVLALRRKDLPSFDRWISFKPDKQLKDLSDYSYMGLLGASLLISSEGGGMRNNVMILSQILLVQSATGKWVKTFTARKRPYVYYEGKLRKNQNSFYSLHSSGAFAIATYSYYYYYRRNGKNIFLATLLYSGAALTAGLRVASAQHFPSDIVTGAVVGSLISYFTCRSYSETRLKLTVTNKFLGVNWEF